MKQVVRTYDELVKVFKLIKDGTNFDKPMEIEFKPYSANRSLSQNALFHVWIGEITEKLNQYCTKPGLTFNTDFVKTDLKRRFGIVSVAIGIDGKETSYLLSTTKYKTDQLSELLTKIHVYASDMGITLSTRSCVDYDNYKEASQ